MTPNNKPQIAIVVSYAVLYLFTLLSVLPAFSFLTAIRTVVILLVLAVFWVSVVAWVVALIRNPDARTFSLWNIFAGVIVFFAVCNILFF